MFAFTGGFLLWLGISMGSRGGLLKVFGTLFTIMAVTFIVLGSCRRWQLGKNMAKIEKAAEHFYGGQRNGGEGIEMPLMGRQADE